MSSHMPAPMAGYVPHMQTTGAPAPPAGMLPAPIWGQPPAQMTGYGPAQTAGQALAQMTSPRSAPGLGADGVGGQGEEQNLGCRREGR